MGNCVFSSLFNTPNVVSGFCHFGLVFFMVLWQSPDTPVMSCFHVSVLEPCALSSACLVLCSDPGTRVLSFGFVSGFRHSLRVLSCCVSVRSGVVRSLVCMFCFVLERGVRIPALMSWVLVSCRGSDTRSVFCLVVWVCSLSSGCFVSCWSVVFGSRHSCLEFRFRVGVQTLALCSVLLCECAVSRLGVLFRVGAWCSDPGTRVLSFGFVSGFRHSRSMFCLVVWVCGLECARPCALLSMQFVFYRCDCYQFTLDVTLCRVLSCCVNVRSRVCSNRALSRLGVLFRVGAWCSDPGTRVLSFGFVSGFRHSRSMFCLVVWACGLECARPCALLSMQFVFYRCDCYQFTIAVTLCRVLSCPAKPCCQSSFPYGVFCLFVLEIKPITLQYWVLASSLYPNPDMWVCYYFHDDAK